MIRPVFTEIALFLIPFAIYALYLWATRVGVLEPQAWKSQTVAWLTLSSLVLMIAGFVLLANFSGAPPGSSYVPAHVEDGRFVPGKTK
jgi:hypothetical protein